ncbi:MAG TPA: aldo/keto reductase [Thermoanaerobaculia bacterium]|nr:aldo/keto reductase [Thermoanaerobaculia bacterium]
MEYRNLGAAGVKVSPLCLGTMMFGRWGNPNHAEVVRIIHRALDAGINFIDTANVYSHGEAEEILGRALAGRRHQVVLATKVWGAMGHGPNERGLSRRAIQEQCEASLRRLGTDVIDLYQIHRSDPEVPWEETLSALTDLVRQGKVRYIGCSTNDRPAQGQPRLPAWEIVETLALSERRGFERFASLQPPYSLLRRTVETEYLPMCQRHGLGVMVWSPLEGGFLTGKYRRGQPNPEDSPRAVQWVGDTTEPRFEPRLAAVEAFAGIAAELGAGLAEAAIAWTLLHPAVTSTIIGPRTPAQLEGCLRALEVSFTPEALARIDEIVPPETSVL